MRFDSFLIKSIQIFLGRLITRFDETLRILHILDIRVLYTSQFQSGWYVSRTCVVVFLAGYVLVVTILVIFCLIGENIAGGRNGVAFYFNSCYLYLTGIGIITRFAGKVKWSFETARTRGILMPLSLAPSSVSAT